MATVESILKSKGTAIYSVTPDSTILDALQLMSDKGIGAVLVMEGDKLLGIYTERDYVRSGVLEGNSEATTISAVMTRQVYYVSPDQSADVCMAQMVDKHFRHLPVVKDGKVVGMISINDVVQTVITDKDSLILGLENYMLGMDFKQ